MRSACEFCERLERPQHSRQWHDFHVVDQTGRFVTVAALGSLVPGSVLIVPRLHVLSMAALDADWRAELARYEEMVHDRIAGTWRPATLFEHGACTDANVSTGACISHAHWHLVPGDYELAGNGVPYLRAGSFDEIAGADRRHGYLAFRRYRGGGWYFNLEYRAPSQYFRRIIAARLGMAEDWDYLGFPMLHNVRATIAGLTGLDPVDGR